MMRFTCPPPSPISLPLQIPSGQVLPVKGTPFDFTQPHTVGERIGQVEGGYDHSLVLFGMGSQVGGGIAFDIGSAQDVTPPTPFSCIIYASTYQAKSIVKNGMASETPRLAATLKDPKSGRKLEVHTTAPAVQVCELHYLGELPRQFNPIPMD